MTARQCGAMDQAILLVRGGMGPVAAARAAGVSYPALWRALQRPANQLTTKQESRK